MRNENVYPAKGVFLPIFFLIAAIFEFCSWSLNRYLGLLFGFVCLFASMLLFYNYLKIKYIFKENSLLIETPVGPKEIEYSSIVRTEEGKLRLLGPLPKDMRWSMKKSMSVAPALWYFGILIVFGADGKIFISPVRRQEFLSKLESRLPGTRPPQLKVDPCIQEGGSRFAE